MKMYKVCAFRWILGYVCIQSISCYLSVTFVYWKGIDLDAIADQSDYLVKRELLKSNIKTKRRRKKQFFKDLVLNQCPLFR